MKNQASKSRRTAVASTLAAVLATGLAPWTVVGAQPAFPSKPVRLLVGFPAGTGPDIVARLLAQKLSEQWGNLGVVVDNKPGAGGLIAASEAARAVPDGYTLMLGETGQLSIAPNTYQRLPYDPQKDFVPVSQVVTSDFVLLVNPQKVPARNVPDFVAWARQRKELFIATFGAGTPGHFGAFMFGNAVQLKPEPVHYKNTNDALGGLFSGDVQAVFARRPWPRPRSRPASSRPWAARAPRAPSPCPSCPPSGSRAIRRWSSIPGSAWSRPPRRRPRSWPGCRPTSCAPCSSPTAAAGWKKPVSA